jgi:polyvinyl alcohol dehydrogenase (cytochrome)
MGPRRTVSAALACILLVALSACGSTKDDSAASPPGTSDGPIAGAGQCDWPMFGHNPSRTFNYPCATDISPDTAADLQLAWFFNTDDVVTATPAVVAGNAYVGDWSGRFYAIDTTTGKPRWTFQAATEPNVYAGNIVSSAAVTDVDGQQVVIFASGRTLYALDTATGAVLWSHAVGTADPDDFTEIESSPVVANGKVFVGIDVHNRPEQRAGFIAVDVREGSEVWYFDVEQGNHHGCGDVWSSPSIDLERGLVFAASGNCPASPDGWGDYVESLFALDLDTGQLRWDYQPHQPNNDDLDFAGAPNLFRVDGRDLVGLGNKDGTYYAVDRDDGSLVWRAKATDPGLDEAGSNFSTGGFIGPTAYSDGIVAGGTAVGPAPFVHGINAVNGDILWQDSSVQAVYGAAAIANGVLFQGNNDFTFRAYDLQSGRELWQHELQGVGAGGSAIVGNDVYTVAGIREPGLEGRSETSGVYKFSLPAPGETFAPSSASTTTTTGQRATNITLEPTEQPCVNTPCDMFEEGITLREPPSGLQPTLTLQIDTDPFKVTVKGTGLGTPEQWLQPGSSAAEKGATSFGLFISESDDNPTGGVLCIMDADYTCSADSLPRLATYNRITLLAVESPDSPLPSAQEGVARLIITLSFNPPLTPVGAK